MGCRGAEALGALCARRCALAAWLRSVGVRGAAVRGLGQARGAAHFAPGVALLRSPSGRVPSRVQPLRTRGCAACVRFGLAPCRPPPLSARRCSRRPQARRHPWPGLLPLASAPLAPPSLASPRVLAPCASAPRASAPPSRSPTAPRRSASPPPPASTKSGGCRRRRHRWTRERRTPTAAADRSRHRWTRERRTPCPWDFSPVRRANHVRQSRSRRSHTLRRERQTTSLICRSCPLICRRPLHSSSRICRRSVPYLSQGANWKGCLTAYKTIS